MRLTASSILGRLQRALEALYRVHASAEVADFVISDEERLSYGVERAPGEQLLLRHDAAEKTLRIGLFIDEKTLARLAGALALDDERLPDFLLATEGVSHFLYVMVRAQAERPFSALELELQAEVDKYLLSLLVTWPRHGAPRLVAADLRKTLFRRIRYHADLSPAERERYRIANDAADEFCASLERRYLSRGLAVDDMLAEARRFWRLDCAGKLDHIAKKAA